MLPAARALPIATRTTDLALTGGLTIVRGWSFVETTGGAPAALELYDGSGINGALIVAITLSQGESTRDWLSGSGIAAMGGLYLHLVTGSIKGAIWQSQATLDHDYAFADGARPVWSGNES
jgi:hypothetical protein